MVTPPWKRDNPQTPTYRPPHYENLPSTNLMSKNRHSAPQLNVDASGGETPPPPRPQKLTNRENHGQQQRPDVNLPSRQMEPQCNVRQQAVESEPVESEPVVSPPVPAATMFNPQKWRDQLQARTNNFKRLEDPLIFQFPVPYRQPEWLQVLESDSSPPLSSLAITNLIKTLLYVFLLMVQGIYCFKWLAASCSHFQLTYMNSK